MRKWLLILMIVSISLIQASCNRINPVQEDEPEDEESVLEEEIYGFSGGNIGAGGGLMAYDDDGYIYYRSEEDHWKLYKSKPDGSDKLKLSDDIPSNINVVAEWVYYTSFSENFSIYRIRTDGTDQELVSREYCDDLYVTDKSIFAGIRGDNNERLIKLLSHDGIKAETLLEDAALLYYYKGFIYYNANDLSLWKFNIQSKGIVQLTDVYSTYVTVDDTGVYYWRPDDNTYNYISPDGNDKAILKNGDYFNYRDGYVYYMKMGYNNYNFYKYDIVTNSEVQLTPFSGELWDMKTGEIIEGVDIYNPGDIFDDPDGSDLYFSDDATGVYVLGNKPYFRGTLLECLKKTGGSRVECLFTVDEGNGLILWD